MLQAAALCEQVALFIASEMPNKQLSEVPVVMAGDYNSLWRKYESDRFDKVRLGWQATTDKKEKIVPGQLRMKWNTIWQ